MSIRTANAGNRLSGDVYLDRMRRKRDQAWEMAGLARRDNDKTDEARHTAEARDWERRISEYLNS
jgi:hypothetical protein